MVSWQPGAGKSFDLEVKTLRSWQPGGWNSFFLIRRDQIVSRMVWRDCPPPDRKTTAHGMERFGRRWRSECAWYGEIGTEMEKRMRMVWRDWAGNGKTNAHGMARLGWRWKTERAWYGEIGLEWKNKHAWYGEIWLNIFRNR